MKSKLQFASTTVILPYYLNYSYLSILDIAKKLWEILFLSKITFSSSHSMLGLIVRYLFPSNISSV